MKTSRALAGMLAAIASGRVGLAGFAPGTASNFSVRFTGGKGPRATASKTAHRKHPCGKRRR